MIAAPDNRFASITTPLGKDVLLFYRMSGHEELSRLFEYNLDLLVEDNNLSSIVTSNILGQAVTVALTLPNESQRYYHGIITQFNHHGVYGDYFLYHATVRPWLWFLTRNSNCRIFQDLSVPDIIKKVFHLNGVSDFELQLTSSYATRDYCVQYRETDFNFVSRLMEHEGIFYFFTHEKTKHTLVIADSVSAYQSITNYELIPHFAHENIAQRKLEHIFEWQTVYKAKTGTYTLNHYDFENPNSNLLAKFSQKKSHAHAEGEHYDYPGEYTNPSVGDTYANIRLDELHTDYEVIDGRTNAMGFTTGMLFTLKDHYLDSENCKHIVIFTDFLIDRSSITRDRDYDCHFKAIRSTQQFRPSRLTPVPFVQGPQTATVVGKDGEEIWTDKYGRIKVQFHWDREGKKNETSSCWVRTAFPVAGKTWGWSSVPRIGQEVVISFLEGNPDRPLITGSVYNSMQMPPYTLPDNQTRSGIKTRSSKEGTADNFNEIRFEDKKGSEEFYVHAEKDFNCVIENNETRKIGLDKKDKGNQTTEIQNDRTITLNEGNDMLTVKQGNYTTQVDMGNYKTQVKMGNYTVDIDAGKATVTAMQSIELKVGGSSIKIDQMGVTVKGMMISIEGQVKVDVKGVMTTVNGDAMLTLKGGLTMIN